MSTMNTVLGSKSVISNILTGSSVSTVSMLPMLEALAKDRTPDTPRENQHRWPSQELHTPETTASWQEEFFENEKLALEKAFLLSLYKGLLHMTSETSVSSQVRHFSVPLRASRRPLMSSVTVPELISVLPRETMVKSAVLLAGVPAGANYDLLQPPYHVTQFEECLKSLDVLPSRDSDVFVAIMDEMAAGMLAPLVL